ncbi:MAG TPA: hypothetical protein VGQ76_20815 [Thermoanaerobaculia bacterium]|jgi:hypothetical protein|nr:hypothetical protein [Thermoanaerobaculia bacterium]
MFALFATYFTANRETFDRDLDEKEWVVLLRNARGQVDGFSTLMQFDVDDVTVFFSGDTVVARHRWGTYDLPRSWAKHVFSIGATLAPREVYWFLISSGYRTYRYLPVFFREFYPTVARATPDGVRSLINRIARAKFNGSYDADAGVVRLATPAPLRAGISDPQERLEQDPHVRFFVERNPNHAAGDELACLVRVSIDNVTPAGRRMIR